MLLLLLLLWQAGLLLLLLDCNLLLGGMLLHQLEQLQG